MVITSKNNNGPLAGAMFWNAAANFTADRDGYAALRGGRVGGT